MKKTKSLTLLLLLVVLTSIQSYGQSICDSCVVLKPKEIDFFIRQKLKADNLEYRNGILTGQIKEYKSLILIKDQMLHNDSLIINGADLLADKQNEKISDLSDQLSKYYRKSQGQKTVILTLSILSLVFGVVAITK